jgi:hypothetical protein
VISAISPSARRVPFQRAQAYADGCPCSLLYLIHQVERQIEQMVRFIKQEAEEKSNEIRVSAEEVGSSRQQASLCSPPAHVTDMLLVCLAGVQPREAAVARARESQDTQGV